MSWNMFKMKSALRINHDSCNVFSPINFNLHFIDLCDRHGAGEILMNLVYDMVNAFNDSDATTLCKFVPFQ